MNLVPLGEILTGEEKIRFLEKLWDLLARQTALYTMDESTSVTTRQARELLESICCTLWFELTLSGLPNRTLAEGDLHELLRNGQMHLEEKRKKLKDLWHRSCSVAGQRGRQEILDRLLPLGVFFSTYDLYFAAHRPPQDAGVLLRRDSLCADLCSLEAYLTHLLEFELI